MDQAVYKQQFNSFLVDTIRQNKSMADRAMTQHVAVRLLLVAGSASLPALVSAPSHLGATVVSVLVAVLTGLDTQFKWGEEWRHFRSTQLTLERLKREYDRRVAALQAGRRVPGIDDPDDNFDRLSQDVEQVLQSESDRFFKFRIAPWKA